MLFRVLSADIVNLTFELLIMVSSVVDYVALSSYVRLWLIVIFDKFRFFVVQSLQMIIYRSREFPTVNLTSFGDLMLLVGWQEERLARKKT